MRYSFRPRAASYLVEIISIDLHLIFEEKLRVGKALPLPISLNRILFLI